MVLPPLPRNRSLLHSSPCRQEASGVITSARASFFLAASGVIASARYPFFQTASDVITSARLAFSLLDRRHIASCGWSHTGTGASPRSTERRGQSYEEQPRKASPEVPAHPLKPRDDGAPCWQLTQRIENRSLGLETLWMAHDDPGRMRQVCPMDMRGFRLSG